MHKSQGGQNQITAGRETQVPALDRLAAALRTGPEPVEVLTAQPLARYTALRIGGPADLLVTAGSVQALRKVVTQAWQLGVPYRVLGGGANVLVSDAGLRGLVVLNRARAITFLVGNLDGETSSMPEVRAESGASFSTVAQQSVARGLAGLEWATGIPGTVGGAVVGNAGAWGSDVAAHLIEAEILEPDGTVSTWSVEQFRYAYRASLLKLGSDQALAARSGRKPVVLAARFSLKQGDRDELKSRVADITRRRKAAQPGGATCGSVFKNPPGDSAGRLIEAAGLKGEQRGGAQISPVHANFIVNRGQATASDIVALIQKAQKEVLARFSVALELEIELLGEW